MHETETPTTFEDVFDMLVSGEERLTWRTRKIWPVVKHMYPDHALINPTGLLTQQRDKLCHELYGMVLPEIMAPVQLSTQHENAILKQVREENERRWRACAVLARNISDASTGLHQHLLNQNVRYICN